METLGGEAAPSLNRLGTRTRIFKNELEYNSFFRVGQHISRRTPCVSAETLNPEYPIVFEEWQLKRTHQTASGIWRTYYCRRARLCRRATGFVSETSRKRKMNARGYTGCNCTAKITVYSRSEGKFPVRVVFHGTHNHDVQLDMLNFLNPIRCCRPIREMVDVKLYSGVTNNFEIRKDIHDELLQNRKQHNNFSGFVIST